MQSFSKLHSSGMVAVPTFDFIVVYSYARHARVKLDNQYMNTPELPKVTMSMYTCCLDVANV